MVIRSSASMTSALVAVGLLVLAVVVAVAGRGSEWGMLPWLVAIALALAAAIIGLPPRVLPSEWGWSRGHMFAWLGVPGIILVAPALIFALLVHAETLAESGTTADLEQAARYFELGDAAGSRVASRERGDVAKSLKSNDRARQYYRRAADQGDVGAASALGELEMNGTQNDGSPGEPNYAEARRWFEIAAAQDNCSALTNLAVMYEKGEGVAVDRARSFDLLERGVKVDCAAAAANLGVLLREHGGGKPDLIRIRSLFKLASDAGDAYGQLNYGAMLANGQGGSRDRTEARRLFERAAKSSDAYVADLARKNLAL